MIVPNVTNEWGDLKEIIVGEPTNAQIPTVKDKSLHCIDYAHLSDEEFENIPTGPYPRNVIQETKHDLHILSQTLESLGVKVHRPKEYDFSQKKSNGEWEVDGYYNYCPRDSMLVIEDKVLSTPMALRQRQFEADNFKPMFNPKHWYDLPRPKLMDNMYSRDDLSIPTLMNEEPAFDAANILKANDDILYLVSNTGNKKGAELLQNWLDENTTRDYKVHTAENVYAYIHIDTTFVLLREGLVLINPSRVNDDNMPDFLRDWDKVICPEPYPTQVMDDWCPASPWLGMNILSVNEKCVIVEEHQIQLMKLLEKWGIESIPISMRHSRTLSGGPHCVTLDVVRT